MKIITKSDGVVTEHEIPKQSVTAIVHQSDIKVEVPGVYTIDAQMTLKCMADMSQDAWVHISTGPLFQHLFHECLFKGNPVKLPATIKALNEDYSEGVIHGCGLIVLLVEAMFAKRKEVYLKYPETHLHPGVVCYLMTMIQEVQKLYRGPTPPVITAQEECS